VSTREELPVDGTSLVPTASLPELSSPSRLCEEHAVPLGYRTTSTFPRIDNNVGQRRSQDISSLGPVPVPYTSVGSSFFRSPSSFVRSYWAVYLQNLFSFRFELLLSRFNALLFSPAC